jgi:uncharacterized protein
MPVVIGEFLATGVYIVCILSLTWFFRIRLDGRPLSEIGLQPDKALRRWGTGLLIGTSTFAACIAIRMHWGLLQFEGLHLSAAVVSSLVSRFLYFVGTGVCEEIAFRGYIFQTVRDRHPLWIAVVVTTVLFALLHVPAAGVDFLFHTYAILVTLIMIGIRLATGSLWTSIGWHTGFDWAIGGLFGFAGARMFLLRRSEALIANTHHELALFNFAYFMVLVANLVAVILWYRLAAPRDSLR